MIGGLDPVPADGERGDVCEGGEAVTLPRGFDVRPLGGGGHGEVSEAACHVSSISRV